jgi:hypothetical protein
MGVVFDQNCHFLAIEKNRRFVIFRTTFLSFLTQNESIGIYRKTGPTKSTVLGPDPPPGREVEIYRFLSFFHDFRAFNRAGKTVTKIGIYSKPPPKTSFYWYFINSRPNFTSMAQQFMFELYVGYCLFLFSFWSSTGRLLFNLRRVFLFSFG